MANKLELDELSTEDAWTELNEDIKPVEADKDSSVMSENETAEVLFSSVKIAVLDAESRSVSHFTENELRTWAAQKLKEIPALEQQLQESNNKIQALENETADLKTEKGSLETQKATLETQNESLKKQLLLSQIQKTYYENYIGFLRHNSCFTFFGRLPPLIPPEVVPEAVLEENIR